MIATLLMTMFLPSKAAAAAATRAGRRRLLFFLLLLLLCSPVLVPLVCLSFPLLLCFAAARLLSGSAHPRPLRQEDLVEIKDRDLPAEGDGGRLLQRYLQDQVRLLVDGDASGDLGSDGDE